MSNQIIKFIQSGKNLMTEEGHHMILSTSIIDIRRAIVSDAYIRKILLKSMRESNDVFYKRKIFRAFRH